MKKHNYNIIELLSQLRRIEPREEYTRLSKERILSSSQEVYTPELTYSPSSLLLRSSFNSVSFALVGMVLIVGVYYATQQLSPLFLPGLNEKSIIAEAEMVESRIDVQLSQLNYFENTSQESNILLQQSSENSLDHLNVPIIQHETSHIEENTMTDATSTVLELNDVLRALGE